jgi:hypothetical protein
MIDPKDIKPGAYWVWKLEDAKKFILFKVIGKPLGGSDKWTLELVDGRGIVDFKTTVVSIENYSLKIFREDMIFHEEEFDLAMSTVNLLNIK